MGFRGAEGTGPGNHAHTLHGVPVNANPATNRRFVCVDPSSKILDAQLTTLARRNTTVLIVGESGVGKEHIAREIHDRSPRHAGPFVAVDCSSFSETLIESHLFGHVRGAFTGADGDRIGYIQAAHGGTLFLDEVGDMPLTLQTRLLRVLQERTVTPVGQTEPVAVDVRILVATHRNLPYLVRTNEFREDLFYRLSAFRMIVPPLRERRGDIVPLANYFLDLQAEIYEEPRRHLSDSAQRWLETQWWRGNVRELANAIECALVASSGDVLQPEDFPDPALVEDGFPEPTADSLYPLEHAPRQIMTLQEAEWHAVTNALRATSGDKTQAARALAISRSRLYSILARQDQPGKPRSSRSAS